MPWKTISIELSDTWIEALEKFAKDNELDGVDDAVRTAIIVYLQRRGYLK
jgi:metal-responsive CopG/Arc/MetJ family transcriptional regulator